MQQPARELLTASDIDAILCPRRPRLPALEVIVEQLADTETSLASIGVSRSPGLVIMADRAEFSMMLAKAVTS